MTDASMAGLGAVLQQQYGDDLMPMAYFSQTSDKAQKNYSPTELEALRVVKAVQHF